MQLASTPSRRPISVMKVKDGSIAYYGDTPKVVLRYGIGGTPSDAIVNLVMDWPEHLEISARYDRVRAATHSRREICVAWHSTPGLYLAHYDGDEERGHYGEGRTVTEAIEHLLMDWPDEE